jgi:DNA-binding response OmpR family regulator
LAEALEQAGYKPTLATDGEIGLALFAQHSYDLLILDVSLPGLDGWDVLREVRSHSDLPVLMLTGYGHEADQLTGFGLGADDYVLKPFSIKQLLARIQAILRRTGHSAHQQLTAGDLTLDLTARTAFVGEKSLSLTAREYALLEILLRNPNRVFTRADLLSRCWSPSYDGVDRVVDVHLASLRRKLGRAGKWVATIRGTGYVFRPPL